MSFRDKKQHYIYSILCLPRGDDCEEVLQPRSNDRIPDDDGDEIDKPCRLILPLHTPFAVSPGRLYAVFAGVDNPLDAVLDSTPRPPRHPREDGAHGSITATPAGLRDASSTSSSSPLPSCLPSLNSGQQTRHGGQSCCQRATAPEIKDIPSNETSRAENILVPVTLSSPRAENDAKKRMRPAVACSRAPCSNNDDDDISGLFRERPATTSEPLLARRLGRSDKSARFWRLQLKRELATQRKPQDCFSFAAQQV